MKNSKPVDTVPETPRRQAAPSGRAGHLDAFARKVLSFPVMMGALLVGLAVLSSRLNLPDPDMWWHTMVGQHILATHAWPTSDSYSFTAPGAHWIAYEWLGEVVMALAAHFGFFQGLTALLMLLGAAFTALLYGYATLVSGNSKAALVACAIFLPLLTVFFTARPQLIGYVFLVVVLICLERYRQGKQKNLWIFPPLFLVWVNTHGSFVFGLAVFGIYWASGLIDFEAGGVRAEPWTPKQRRHLALVFLLSVLALMVTPYGTQPAAYPLQMALSQPLNVAHISEWQALDVQIWQMKLLLILVLAFWLAHIPLRQTYRLENVVLLFLATYACFVHRRFMPFLILILAPFIAKMIARWMPKYRPEIDQYAVNAILIGLGAFGLVLAFPSQKTLDKAVAKRYPQKAVEYLSRHPQPGPMLNEYDWGGYLIWAPGLHHKVFVDGRADFYEYAGVLSDYFDIAGVRPDTRFLLHKYHIQFCLIHRNAPLGTFLDTLPGWEKVYQDKLSEIFIRPTQPPSSTSERPVPHQVREPIAARSKVVKGPASPVAGEARLRIRARQLPAPEGAEEALQPALAWWSIKMEANLR
ncbi:MAG TPA: hypothetical protein VMW54_00475 [Terriglobia bacterium]|nr:hypothetical protein [Terriglobia bacterium]